MSLNFTTANLIVDWVGFKFQTLDDVRQEKLAKYLLKFGFNSYRASNRLSKKRKRKMFEDKSNQFKVIFYEKTLYWNGTLVNFSGSSGAFFYSYSKNKSN